MHSNWIFDRFYFLSDTRWLIDPDMNAWKVCLESQDVHALHGQSNVNTCFQLMLLAISVTSISNRCLKSNIQLLQTLLATIQTWRGRSKVTLIECHLSNKSDLPWSTTSSVIVKWKCLEATAQPQDHYVQRTLCVKINTHYWVSDCKDLFTVHFMNWVSMADQLQAGLLALKPA